ncbi:MAG: HNH endonuclease signature motif containing protein [Betaproteobacteria bacterium]|nr:HNH endonuclease signature motif containing protein [Betaproteobacteria bacterium]
MNQKQLKSVLHYDSNTGVFTWLKWKKGCRKNCIAGYVDTRGYVKICINQSKPYKAHRLAWLYVYGEWPDIVDHMNRNPSDNRLCNLRNVSHSGNQKNTKLRIDNSTGIPGVGWDKTRNKWMVRIHSKGQIIAQLRFSDFFEAVCFRKSKEIDLEYHPNHGKAF